MRKNHIPKLQRRIVTRNKKRVLRHIGNEPQLVCSRCKSIFPEFLGRCPECGAKDWVGISEVNPYNHLAMEQFLRLCGHLLWFIPTLGTIYLLWQINDAQGLVLQNYIMGSLLLFSLGIVCSVAFFGLSELNRRVIRIQKRLRAFHENYRGKQRIRSRMN